MTDLIKQVGGLQKAKDIVNGAPYSAFAYDTIDNEYMFCGDIQDGYLIDDYNGCFTIFDLEKAIADYNTDHCGDIINHVSPLTQVYEK